MLSRILYCSLVLLSTAAVILLSLSSLPHHHTPPHLSLSFYIQHPYMSPATASHPVAPSALVFHRTLTAGPENASRIIGKAQGFIIPVQSFAHSAFNIIYLTVDTREYSGSVSVEAKDLGGKEKEVMSVVGGTGSFAFARGVAVFARLWNVEASYRVKLDLEFGNGYRSVPG